MNAAITTPRPRLRAGEIYLGDNGRAMCADPRCAGQTALYSGRDLSGQKLLRLRPRDLAFIQHRAGGRRMKCECGKTEAPDQTPEVVAARIYRQLPPAWVLYAASKDRGHYGGFAALHDLCDANMLVVSEFPMPDCATDTPDALSRYCAACSPIMQEVTRLIVDSPLAHIPTDLTNHRPCQP